MIQYRRYQNKRNFSVDLAKSSDIEWEPIPEAVMLSSQEEQSTLAAKLKELENWKQNNVYEEVPSSNQKAISTRWVITPKEINGQLVTKARLVVRGFEDEAVEKTLTNSPTCSKETIRVCMSLISSNKWKCCSIDAKTAFLQGNPLKRDIYIKPPKEAETTSLWRLKKAVYGLNEASRHWYEKVKDELLKLGFQCSKFDEAFFFLKSENKLAGLMSVHVDDFLNGGNNIFRDQLAQLKSQVTFGEELPAPFKFLGTNVKQNEDMTISINQKEYSDEIEPMEISNKKAKMRVLNQDEQYQYRKVVGQLNWLSSQSRPDLSYDVCQLSIQ